jgi:serine/threonine-protein kinase
MEIARQACSALAAAHAADIVHRDLKPENLFVLRGSAVLPELQVKVLDFGIAKVKPAGGGQPTVKTRAGLVMGSPAYMSPEQCKDSSDVDHRTDIYSMGVIVYEMLAGAPPFAAASAADLLVMQLSAAPPALRLRVPDVPEHVEQAVMRALAKDRAARYARIDELVAALLDGPVAPEGPAKVAGGAPALGASGLSLAAGTAVLANGVPANPPSRPITTFALASGESAVSASPEPARRAWRVPLAAGAALVLLVGLGVVLLKRRSPTVAERPAIGAVPAHPRAGDPVPPATVRLRVQSSPAGAAVLDGSATVLGRTPFEQLFPQGEGTTRLTVRLAGYDDATVTLGLDADSQTVVSLRPAGTPGRRVGAAVQPTDKTRPRPRPRTVPSADHEWIAH